jgi:hypothetical protein
MHLGCSADVLRRVPKSYAEQFGNPAPERLCGTRPIEIGRRDTVPYGLNIRLAAFTESCPRRGLKALHRDVRRASYAVAIAILVQCAEGSLYISQSRREVVQHSRNALLVRDALSGVEPVIPALLAAQFSNAAGELAGEFEPPGFERCPKVHSLMVREFSSAHVFVPQ